MKAQVGDKVSPRFFDWAMQTETLECRKKQLAHYLQSKFETRGENGNGLAHLLKICPFIFFLCSN